MKWFKLPSILPRIPIHRDPRDWRAAVALVASVFGSMALTLVSVWLAYVMWKGGWPIETATARIEILGKALMMALTGSLVVLITLGFAINRRSIRVSKDGFEAVGGDGDHAAPATPSISMTTTAEIKPDPNA